MIDYVDKALFNNDSLDKQIHIVSSDNTVSLGNEDIISESFQLIESLCSEEYLKFGAVEPRCVKFTVKYSAPEMINKWLHITMSLEGSSTPFNFGDYQVLSDKPSSDRTTREITAHGHYHKILNNTYKNWYKSAWGNSKTMTIKEFRDSFFARLQQTHPWVVQETTTLINDNAIIRKAKRIPRISGKDILNAICEINGVFGYVDRDNVFRYITLDTTSTSTNIESKYTISTEYEDYNTVEIDRVEIMSQNGDLLAEAGETSSDSQNKYVVESNFMVKALGTTETSKDVAQIIAYRLLEAINTVSFTPFDAEFKGNPCFEVGDKISFESHGNTITTFLLERNLKGVQSLHDEFAAQSGDSVYPQVANNTTSKMQKVKDDIADKSEISVDTYDPNIEGLTGQEGDMYVQTDTSLIEKYTIDRNSLVYEGADAELYIDEITLKMMAGQWSENGYYFAFSQVGVQHHNTALSSHWGEPRFKVTGITKAGTYKFHAKVAHTCDIDSDNLLGFAFVKPNFTLMPAQSGAAGDLLTYSEGVIQNLTKTTGQFVEYTGEFSVPSTWVSYGFFYFWIVKQRTFYVQHGINVDPCSVTIRELYIYHEDDTYDETHDIFPTSQYVNVELPNTSTNNTRRSVGDLDNDTTNKWVEIKRISEVDESEEAGGTTNNGLQVSTDGRMKLSLKPNVMRAWVKADPPQTTRNFNQFCVRYTGAPASGVTISYHGASGWSNTSVKRADDGVYTIKCGGTRTSGIDYVAYKIEGLTIGKKYYFNFATNIGNSATFGNDNTKGLGVVFNTTGVINTNDWTGDPDTWHEDTLYYSMYRRVQKNYIDFSFTATAATMYMCVVVADITVGVTTTMALTEFVLSESERKYIRNFYLFDTVENEWLQFRPFGTNDGGGVDISALSDLTDVSFNNLLSGQILKFDGTSWINANEYSYTLPKASDETLGGIKVGSNLNIESDGTLNVIDGSLSELSDVTISSLANDQTLRYNSTLQKWVNADTGKNLFIGTANPNNSVGSDGDMYVKRSEYVSPAYSYFKLVMLKNRSNPGYTNLGEITLLKDDDTEITWSNYDATITTTSAAVNASEGIDKVIDGSLSTYYTTRANPTSESPIEIVITTETPVDLSDYTRYGWYTAAQLSARDMVSWEFYVSKDGETWELMDTVSDYSVTTDRSTLAYQSVLNVGSTPLSIADIYIKINGAWIKANQTGGASAIEDLTDVNLTNLSNNQILKYNSTSQKWENSADTGGADAVEITWAAYQALTTEQKADPTKVYYVTDYPTPSGIDLGDIDDVDLSSPADGQVLKYDATNDKWINANESGGGSYTLPTASDTTKGGIKVGNGLGILDEVLSVDCGNGIKIDSNGLVAIDPVGTATPVNLLYTYDYYTPSSPIQNNTYESFSIDILKSSFLYGDVSGKTVVSQGIIVIGVDSNDNRYYTLITQSMLENRVDGNDNELVRVGAYVFNNTGVSLTKLYVGFRYILL